MSETNTWEELSVEAIDNLAEEHGFELVKAKTELLKEMRSQLNQGHTSRVEAYAKSYALISGTLGSVAS